VDSLQAAFAAHTPALEALDDGDADAATVQAAAAVLVGDISSAPLAAPVDDDSAVADADDVADRAIFAALVAG
jgi:hypothetical protein